MRHRLARADVRLWVKRDDLVHPDLPGNKWRKLKYNVQAAREQGLGTGSDNWRVVCDFHFGGFAKRTPELHAFIADFRKRHGIELDWVYVAKMMYGIFALADRGTFRPGTRIVAVITG